jgi:hypothetical protein
LHLGECAVQIVQFLGCVHILGLFGQWRHGLVLSNEV